MGKTKGVRFQESAAGGNNPPPWNKDHPPYNCLAYLVSKGKVKEGAKASKVHELLPLFSQYKLDNFRPNLRNMLKYYKAGKLVFNKNLIPANIMTMIDSGKMGGFRSEQTQNDVDDAMEGMSVT